GVVEPHRSAVRLEHLLGRAHDLGEHRHEVEGGGERTGDAEDRLHVPRRKPALLRPCTHGCRMLQLLRSDGAGYRRSAWRARGEAGGPREGEGTPRPGWRSARRGSVLPRLSTGESVCCGARPHAPHLTRGCYWKKRWIWKCRPPGRSTVAVVGDVNVIV